MEDKHITDIILDDRDTSTLEDKMDTPVSDTALEDRLDTPERDTSASSLGPVEDKIGTPDMDVPDKDIIIQWLLVALCMIILMQTLQYVKFSRRRIY